MCVVSMVSDFYQDKWSKKDYDWLKLYITTPILPPNVTREEFEVLKKEILEMKELLIKAKEYDKKNNEPNCEMENKVKFLKEISKVIGVDLNEIFRK